MNRERTDAPADGADGSSRGRTPLLPLDAAAPPRDELETATFAMGCFWGPDARFGVLPGVVRTRVGYTGGDAPRPTYEALGRHIETVQVEFDPVTVGLGDLLEVWWEGHDPFRAPRKRQYLSAVFWRGDEQRETVERFLAERRPDGGGEPVTESAPLETFWLAEAYHQKYRLRQQPELLEAFRGYTGRRFVDSTVAARLNGFVAGLGTADLLEREISRYGLSTDARRRLRDLVGVGLR